MKEVNCKVWELTREEVAKLPDKTKVLVYNLLFNDFKLIGADRLISKLPQLSKFNVFFTLNEPNLNNYTETCQNKKKKGS